MPEWLKAIIDSPGASIGAGTGILALCIAIAAWLFPRRPSSKKIPEYRDEIRLGNSYKFTEFLEKNDRKLVRLSTYIPYEDEEIVSETASDDGHLSHAISLKVRDPDGGFNFSLELAVVPEKGSINSPLVFANGAYHLRGFFIPEHHPGMWQGTMAASITEVSAEQLALRS